MLIGRYAGASPNATGSFIYVCGPKTRAPIELATRVDILGPESGLERARRQTDRQTDAHTNRLAARTQQPIERAN